MRTLSICWGCVVAMIGLGGCVVGVARIMAGETQRGLADLIVGGFVGLWGASIIRGDD